MRTILIILLAVFVYACDRADGPRPAARSGGSDGGGLAASYERNFLLLSRQENSPVVAVLDFSAVEAPESVRRSAAAWLLRDGGWQRLIELEWDDEPIREPWRLVPHADLRVLVGDGGEIEALVHRADSTGFRLLPSPAVTEWSTGDAAQFWLRRGELRLDDRSIMGVLLDLQTGAPVEQRGRTEVAFLTDGQSSHLVLVAGGDGRTSARLFSDSEEHVWEDVSLVPLDMRPTEVADQVATADTRTDEGWRIQDAKGGLKGELRPTGEPLVTERSAEGFGTFVVDGWIEARGQRRPIFGVVRRELE